MTLTYEEAWAQGKPLPDFMCAGCGEPYSSNCQREHEHAGWMDCVNVYDVRQFQCGCYGHKDCCKSGIRCQEHGAYGEPRYNQNAAQPNGVMET